MSGVGDRGPDPEDQALAEFTGRWMKALACFRTTSKPQWKRTQEAMVCFKGLPLDNLPPRLRRRLDAHFAWINSIVEPYTLRTWDDYQKVSAADLTRIEKILDTLADPD
jgi:hypothetical protein